MPARSGPGPLLAALRAKRPLVHNITNAVVTNFTANVLLSVGASPAMVQAREEVAEFAALADALVVNIGTLDSMKVESMHLAAQAAVAGGKPWVLDPVGAGATRYRTDTALSLLALSPSVLRANAGEILALAGARDPAQKGVDSGAGPDAALQAAQTLARQFGCLVAVTGATDRVVDASGIVASVSGGVPAIQSVTGTGCATTALVGAFLAVAPPAAAAVAALTLMKRAAERAAAGDPGPGTLAVRLIDALAALTPADLGGHS
jgi:hydroxyethylthiazole kinase